MDTGTVIAAITGSLGTSLAGCYWFAKSLITHRLARALEDRKSELSQQLETHKLGLNQDLERTKADLQQILARDKSAAEGAIRKEVEAQLGDLAAKRQYEYEARRRLYVAIGPLRFQLLLACRDAAGRIESFAFHEGYQLNLKGYYGQSTLYRLLRPIAISDLLEEQVALADFSLDPEAVLALRFRRSATRIFSGDEVVGDHPDVNWSTQEQHVYADTLSGCARVLIDRNDRKRILRFEEFCELLEMRGTAEIAPFDMLLDKFSLGSKPILWLRLVAFGNACNALIDRMGGGLGFESRPFEVEALIERGGDRHINSKRDEYLDRIRKVELVPL